MKRSGLCIFISLLLAAVFLLTSCGALDELLEELSRAAESGSDTYGGNVTEAPTAMTEENGIPYIRTPEIESCSLPEASIGDALEAEASALIDNAIENALSCLNAMKDVRHSSRSYPFDPDANGFISKLDASEKAVYDSIVSAGREFADYRISDEEYDGDLMKLYFSLYEPLTCCEPGLASYLDTDAESYLLLGEDEVHYTSVSVYYFDAEKDQNYSVRKGSVTKEEVVHQSQLLDRIVKRIVRFMPEDISAYDKYYYLAAVLSEKIVYDSGCRNSFTAYGALAGGRCVCEGYAAAYYLLCREADLWCGYKYGMPDGVGHVWNIVKLDSGIYNVDVTFCDGSGKPYEPGWYDYFMKTDEYLNDDGHSITSGPASTGTYEPCPYEE